MDARQAHANQMWRLRLFFLLDDLDIDQTSPIGLFVIDNYMPAMKCTCDEMRALDPDVIQEWIDDQWAGGANAR